MGLDYQLHRVSVDLAKGYGQIQKAGAAFNKGKTDSGVNHINKALNYYDAAMDHAVQAEDDACAKAGKEIDKGNADLKKSADEYSKGHVERAEAYYDSAVDNYDKALDLIN